MLLNKTDIAHAILSELCRKCENHDVAVDEIFDAMLENGNSPASEYIIRGWALARDEDILYALKDHAIYGDMDCGGESVAEAVIDAVISLYREQIIRLCNSIWIAAAIIAALLLAYLAGAEVTIRSAQYIADTDGGNAYTISYEPLPGYRRTDIYDY